jgi:queuine tRNA-ribosyltransferase
MNAIHAKDPNPIDAECRCYTCLHFSRAYLRHLIMAKEMLASTLISIHNIFTLVELSRKLRAAIIGNDFDNQAGMLLSQLKSQNYLSLK